MEQRLQEQLDRILAADMYSEAFGVSYEDAFDVFADPANLGCVYEVGESMIGIVDI